MDRKTIERQLIDHCHGARMITTKELRTFVRPDGKIGDDALCYYLKGVEFIRTGRGGTKNYFIPDVARRMNEIAENE